MITLFHVLAAVSARDFFAADRISAVADYFCVKFLPDFPAFSNRSSELQFTPSLSISDARAGLV